MGSLREIRRERGRSGKEKADEERKGKEGSEGEKELVLMIYLQQIELSNFRCRTAANRFPRFSQCQKKNMNTCR